MEFLDINQIELPQLWKKISNDHEVEEIYKEVHHSVADTVTEELKHELCEGHCLYGVEFRAIACDTRAMKDYLFVTDDVEKPFARVHLTFNVETDPAYPFTNQFSCFEEFIQYEEYLDNLNEEEILKARRLLSRSLKERALIARELLRKDWRDQ